MTSSANKALLPAGLQDILPPDAAREAAVVERLVASFAAEGYERVKPPLIEFEETLLAGTGEALAPQSFRLMDPVSQRMMSLRADITPQVVRIAATRLKRAARPLRLCYAGQVLRVRGTQFQPERQVAQVGAELIGAEGVSADAEVIVLAAESLRRVGVQRLSIDLNLPPLIAALAHELPMEEERLSELRQALDRKDVAAVKTIAGKSGSLFAALLQTAGKADSAMTSLAELKLPELARRAVGELGEVVALIRRAMPDLEMTIDPVENRGFEYQTGISFTLFARGVRGELGRGGRYQPSAEGEGSSTGFTLYMDAVLRALPPAECSERVYLPFGTAPEAGRALRAEGWVTLAGLTAERDVAGEARRLGCSHILRDGEIQSVER